MRLPKEYTVYMLKCCDNSYYIGLTSSVSLRLYQHSSGQLANCYTYKRRPIELVYSANFNDVYDAIAWERRIKRWSRMKKEALITQNQNLLIKASKRKTKVTAIQEVLYKIRFEIKKLKVGHGS